MHASVCVCVCVCVCQCVCAHALLCLCVCTSLPLSHLAVRPEEGDIAQGGDRVRAVLKVEHGHLPLLGPRNALLQQPGRDDLTGVCALG